jgi:hypothetical protein
MRSASLRRCLLRFFLLLLFFFFFSSAICQMAEEGDLSDALGLSMAQGQMDGVDVCNQVR